MAQETNFGAEKLTSRIVEEAEAEAGRIIVEAEAKAESARRMLSSVYCRPRPRLRGSI